MGLPHPHGAGLPECNHIPPRVGVFRLGAASFSQQGEQKKVRRKGSLETPEVCCEDPSLGLQRQLGDAVELAAGRVRGPFLATFSSPLLHIHPDRLGFKAVQVSQNPLIALQVELCC